MFADRLPQRAQEKGHEFVTKLHALLGRGGLTGVRGRGLLIGLDFRDPGATQRFVKRCFSGGLVLGWTLHEDTVVRLAPPLVISSAEIDRAIAVMGRALDRG
jgi:acetylornithine/succinyldiaminopimelate/putrescine aminotransferase